VLTNLCMNLVLGIPLEGLHGSFRIAAMYNIGVFGGACCYWVADSRKSVVGMSGGCYALIGIHVAGLAMNWSQTRFRKPVVLFLAILITLEVLAYHFSLGAANASHSAHIGGSVAGLIIGLLVGRNIKRLDCERLVWCAALFTAAALLAFSISWLVIHNPPRPIFEEYGWCWQRQVLLPATFGQIWQCVRCPTRECIQHYKQRLTVVESACPNFYFEGNFYDN